MNLCRSRAYGTYTCPSLFSMTHALTMDLTNRVLQTGDVQGSDVQWP